MDEIKVGMIVKYNPNYCTEGERKYLHVVKENRLNPITHKPTRWLIETINMQTMKFNPTEVVESDMIIPTGFTVDNLTAAGDPVV